MWIRKSVFFGDVCSSHLNELLWFEQYLFNYIQRAVVKHCAVKPLVVTNQKFQDIYLLRRGFDLAQEMSEV